jgi:hypothetical protein
MSRPRFLKIVILSEGEQEAPYLHPTSPEPTSKDLTLERSKRLAWAL